MLLKLLKSKIFWAIAIFGMVALFDIWLHRGMIRVMNPPAFTDKRKATNGLPVCGAANGSSGQIWKLRVDDAKAIKSLKEQYGGFSVAGAYDSRKADFWVERTDGKFVELEELLKAREKNPQGLLLAVNDLRPTDFESFFNYLYYIDSVYKLNKNIIIQTRDELLLKPICDAGYSSSYHIPFLNPYHSSESEFISWLDSLTVTLKKYPATYLSATYYQSPVLEKFFPDAHQILWIDKADYSVVGPLLKRKLKQNNKVSIILEP